MSLRFSLKPNEIPVVLEDENGEEIQCVLKEMDGQSRDKYLNVMSKKVAVGPDGSASIRTYDGHLTDLVKRCLFYQDSGQPVPEDTIKKFPSRVLSALFDEANKLNKLGDEDITDSEGNSNQEHDSGESD